MFGNCHERLTPRMMTAVMRLYHCLHKNHVRVVSISRARGSPAITPAMLYTLTEQHIHRTQQDLVYSGSRRAIGAYVRKGV